MVKNLLALALALALVGCATVNKQAFNRDAAKSIAVVVVTQPPNQDSYEAAVIGHAGASFGLIGGLIAAADIQAKSNRFTAAIDPVQTRLQERLTQALAERLKAVGYDTAAFAVPKDATDAQWLEAARKMPNAHAALYVKSVGGYWAAGHATSYVPRVVVVARLADIKSGATLFEDTFSYGYASPNMKSIHAGADAKYSYKDIDALVSNPTESRQGLIDGVEVIAKQIAEDLRRN